MTKIYVEDILNGFLIPTLNDIEDSLLSILAVYDIDRMEGEGLKKIADMVGLKKSHNDTAIYRKLIKGQVLANTANGTVDDIDNVLKILFDGNARRLEYNCCIKVEVKDDPPSAELKAIYLEIVQACLPAGVGLIDIVFYNDDTLIYNVGEWNVKKWG